MLFEYLKHTNLLESSKIDETIDSLSIKITPDAPMNSFVLKLFDELKTISSRDTFELFFDVSGNHIKISDCCASSLTIIKDHINEYADETDYELDLQIRKHLVERTLSIYFLSEFSRYLEQENPYNFLHSLSVHFDSRLNFEVFSSLNKFGSNTIIFYEAFGDNKPISQNEENGGRNDKLDLLFENSSVTNLSLKLIPSDFYLLKQSVDEGINSFFQKQCSILSLIFISNSSVLSSDGLLSYKISGYKTISSESLDLQNLADKYKLLYKIYSWAFEGGNSSDKIGLVRNVLSIHLDESGNVKFDDEVWEVIQSNYQIYLKKNIQSYLEIKNKIGEFIIESTTKTYAMADELLDSLKNNVFIFLTFILTVVVVNGLKDNGSISVFSNAYLAIVIILALVSTLWLFMINREISSRFDNATETIKKILKLNYNKVIMESEINECVDPVIKENRIYLRRQLRRYSIWWICILVIFVLSFLIANRVFLPADNIFKISKPLPENICQSPDGANQKKLQEKLNKSMQPTVNATVD